MSINNTVGKNPRWYHIACML